jgi:2-polyprenyl-6-hydroxyphenyl methylase/3-demethylubiquinone-9 3-methyltransferase
VTALRPDASTASRPIPAAPAARPRNDPAQYDDLVGEWWKPDGAFAALHWLAEARARLIPPAPPGGVLVDIGCGGGLLAPLVASYRHLGVDLSEPSLRVARDAGVLAVRGDASALPLADESADAVVAGEVLEHVADLDGVVAEAARVCKPGGRVVIDTINATPWARFSLVTVGERTPGGPPPHCHDPALFVPPRRLQAAFARHGVELAVRGLRFSVRDFARYLARRDRPVRMLPTRSLSAVYQGVGRKAS